MQNTQRIKKWRRGRATTGFIIFLNRSRFKLYVNKQTNAGALCIYESSSTMVSDDEKSTNATDANFAALFLTERVANNKNIVSSLYYVIRCPSNHFRIDHSNRKLQFRITCCILCNIRICRVLSYINYIHLLFIQKNVRSWDTFLFLDACTRFLSEVRSSKNCKRLPKPGNIRPHYARVSSIRISIPAHPQTAKTGSWVGNFSADQNR